MSWQKLNEIVGMAMIDQVFSQQLLENPLDALHARGIQLPKEEQELLCGSQARSIQELSQYLITKHASEASDSAGEKQSSWLDELRQY